MTSLSSTTEAKFPNLTQAGYEVTSPQTPDYNCIAWAAGDDSAWWEPVPAGDDASKVMGGYYWPRGVPLEPTLASYERAFKRQGYRVCDSRDLEDDWEKIAIFVDGQGRPTHAARQLESGDWASKLGALEDIEHKALDGVSGPSYGDVGLVMRRKRRDDLPHPRARNVG